MTIFFFLDSVGLQTKAQKIEIVFVGAYLNYWEVLSVVSGGGLKSFLEVTTMRISAKLRDGVLHHMKSDPVFKFPSIVGNFPVPKEPKITS